MLDRFPAREAMRARCQLVAPRAQNFLHPTQISLCAVQISLDNLKIGLAKFGGHFVRLGAVLGWLGLGFFALYLHITKEVGQRKKFIFLVFSAFLLCGLGSSALLAPNGKSAGAFFYLKILFVPIA
jgi:hypothetical protein